MSNESSHQRNTTEILPDSKPEKTNSVPSADEAEALYATARRLQETGDNDKAADCYEKAAQLGYAPALEALCEIAHRLRRTGRGDWAYDCFLKAARLGCPEAQYMMLYLGYGSDAEINFCRKAAEQGYAPAQRLLGMRAGLSVADASLWLHRAAVQGDVEAALMLGNGASETELPDMEALREALRRYPVIRRHPLYITFEKAIRGFSEAQRELAARYEKGRDVTLDDVIAEKWYERVALQGDTEAMMWLAKFHSCRSNYSSHFYHFCKSYSDHQKAVFWLAQAGLRCEKTFYHGRLFEGSWKSGFFLSSYERGICYSLALECFKRASEHRDDSAAVDFKRLQTFNARDAEPLNDKVVDVMILLLGIGVLLSLLLLYTPLSAHLLSKWNNFADILLNVFIIVMCVWAFAALIITLISVWWALKVRSELERAAAVPMDNLDEAVRLYCNMSPEIKQETIYPAPEEGLEIKEPRTAEKSTDSGKSSFER